jgi:indole-3-glycerol phosphate synthase
MSFLDTIVAHKRQEVSGKKLKVQRSRLEDMPKFGDKTRSLAKALSNKDVAIIAEIKKASPSKNIIRHNFDPLAIAREYMRDGASAVSVLTDENFFLGKLEFIEQMRHFVSVPILCKDFIIDSFQLYEAKAYGADAVLLIAAILEPEQLIDLAEEAATLGLESLVEVHSEEEIESLNFSSLEIIGINNRDLMTFETDLYTSVRLKKYIPSGKLVVSESGLSSGKDLDMLMSHGIHAFLIGELFMRAENPGAALAKLLREAEAVRGQG